MSLTNLLSIERTLPGRRRRTSGSLRLKKCAYIRQTRYKNVDRGLLKKLKRAAPSSLERGVLNRSDSRSAGSLLPQGRRGVKLKPGRVIHPGTNLPSDLKRRERFRTGGAGEEPAN